MLNDNGHNDLNWTHDARQAHYSPRAFVESLVSLKNRVAAGHSVIITYNERLYYAVPLGDTSHLRDENKTEIIRDVALETDKGQRGTGKKTVIRFKDHELERMLDKLTDITCQSICFTGQEAMSFITEEAHNRLLVRKEKERQRFRQIAADEGATFSSAPKTMPVEEIPAEPAVIAQVPAPAPVVPAPVRRPVDPANPFSDIRTSALPLFIEEIYFNKDQVVKGRPVRIVYDNKHFYGVSVHQAKGLKVHSTPVESGDVLTIKASALHDILKSLRDNTAETLVFNKGQICLINQSAFDKIQAKALEEAGIAPAPQEETEVQGRKRLSDRQTRLAEQAGIYNHPGLTITKVHAERYGWDHHNVYQPDNHPEEGLVIHRSKAVGVVITLDHARKAGLPEADIGKELSDNESAWSEQFHKNFGSLRSLKNVAGTINHRNQKVFYATLAYMKEHPEAFARVLGDKLIEKAGTAWMENTRTLLNTYWLRTNPVSLSTMGQYTYAVVSLVNGVGGQVISDLFKPNMMIALTDHGEVKALAFGNTKGRAAYGKDILHIDPGEYREHWKKVKDNFPGNTVMSLEYGTRTMTIISPKFDESLLAALLHRSPKIERMLEIIAGQPIIAAKAKGPDSALVTKGANVEVEEIIITPPPALVEEGPVQEPQVEDNASAPANETLDTSTAADSEQSAETSEEFPEQFVLRHQKNIIGVIMPLKKAEDIDFAEVVDVLNHKEIKSRSRFSGDYTGYNAMRNVAGQVDVNGRIRFYASLEFMHTHASLFERVLGEGVMQEVHETWMSNYQNLVSDYLTKVSSQSLTDLRLRPGQFVEDVNTPDAQSGTPGTPQAMLIRGEVKGIALPGTITGRPAIGPHKAAPFGDGWEEFKSAESEDAVLVLTGAKFRVSVVKPNFGTDLLPAILQNMPSNKVMVDEVLPRKGAKPAPRIAQPEAPKTEPVAAEVQSQQEPVIAPPVAPVEPPAPVQPPAALTPTFTQPAAPAAPRPAEGGANILQRVARIANTLKDLKIDGSKLVEVMIDDNRIVGFGADRSSLFSDDSAIKNLAEIYDGLKGASDPTLEYKLVAYDDSVSVKDKIGILKQAFDDTAGNQKLVILRAGQQTIIVGNNTAFTEIVRDYV